MQDCLEVNATPEQVDAVKVKGLLYPTSVLTNKTSVTRNEPPPVFVTTNW